LAYKDWDLSDPLNTPPADHDPATDGEFVKTGSFTWISKVQMLDIIGTIYQDTGNTLTDPENGAEYPERSAIDGFHANLRVDELTDEQIAALPIVDAPATPYRKWAGDE
jgi:hypothetical protein